MLEELVIQGGPFLEDVSDVVRTADTMRVFKLEDCLGIDDLNQIGLLTNVTTLGISNCGPIESLRPIANLTRVEELYAWGTTRILDNDLSVLTRLPNLRELRMRSRREYDPSVEEIQEKLARRTN
jgi:Leucine-rich repeat (LRR) protein